MAAANTGIAPFRGGEFESKTIDQQVAEVIGKVFASICGGFCQRRPQAELFQPSAGPIAPIGTRAPSLYTLSARDFRTRQRATGSLIRES